MVFVRRLFLLLGLMLWSYEEMVAEVVGDPSKSQTLSSTPRRRSFQDRGIRKSARKIAQGVRAAEKAIPQDPFHAQSVWDQKILEQQTELTKKLRAFTEGTYAASLKSLKISGQTVEDLEGVLTQKGFRKQEHKMVPSSRSRHKTDYPSLPPHHAPQSSETQKIYVHDDGGVVHLKLLGHRWHSEPHGVKYVLKDPQKGPSYANEAFKVTDDGFPIPKSPRPEDGLRTSDSDLSHPDQIFGWTDAIMEAGHMDLKNMGQK